MGRCYIIADDEIEALSDLSLKFTENTNGDDQMVSCAILQTPGDRKDKKDKPGPERPFLLKMHHHDIVELMSHALNQFKPDPSDPSGSQQENMCENFYSKPDQCGPEYTGIGGVIYFRVNGNSMFRFYNNENVSEDFGRDRYGNKIGRIEVLTQSVGHETRVDKRDAIQFDFISEDFGQIGSITLVGRVYVDDPSKPASEKVESTTPAGKLYHLLKKAGQLKHAY